METLGSLCDKESIANLRVKAIISRGRMEDPTENEKMVARLQLVRKQYQDLHNEITEYIRAAKLNADMQLQEPKYKMYQNENTSGVTFNNWKDAADHLAKTNAILWDLEDKRRDKSRSDAEIRAICDEVARYNRIRNDSMDEINRLFQESLSGRNTQ